MQQSKWTQVCDTLYNSRSCLWSARLLPPAPLLAHAALLTSAVDWFFSKPLWSQLHSVLHIAVKGVKKKKDLVQKSCKGQSSNIKQTCQIVSSKIKNDRILDNAFVHSNRGGGMLPSCGYIENCSFRV